MWYLPEEKSKQNACGYHIIAGVKLHIDSFSVPLPGVVLRAPAIVYNDDHEKKDFNDDDIGIPGVALRAPAHVYNNTLLRIMIAITDQLSLTWFASQ